MHRFMNLVSLVAFCALFLNLSSCKKEPELADDTQTAAEDPTLTMVYSYMEDSVIEIEVTEYEGKYCTIGKSDTTMISSQYGGGVCTYVIFGYHIWYYGGSEVALKFDLSVGNGPWVEHVPISNSKCERGTVHEDQSLDPISWERDAEEGNAILCQLHDYFDEKEEWVLMTFPAKMRQNQRAFTPEMMDAFNRSFPQKE